MATGTVTPPALKPATSTAGAPTAKERKYDRQLRLWAANGQKALEEAHVLLLNSGSGVVGVETLKNLVLPGMGRFTIVDPAIVQEEDLGVNFFLEDSSLGKSRAEECTAYLRELNPDVEGHGIKQDFTTYIESDALLNFTLILACGFLRQEDHQKLLARAWQAGIPVITVSCAGFYSVFSIQLPEFFPIVETHPDPASTQDLRLLQPWKELSDLAVSKTGDLQNMSDYEHGHVPYLLLLLHYLEQWKSKHDGASPTSYKDKVAFRESVKAGARTANPEGGEENFDEAVAAVLKSLNVSKVPHSLESIFKEEQCRSPVSSSSDFWFIAHGVWQFTLLNAQLLPLPGSVPDMKAQSKDYIELQNTYKAKSRIDVAAVTSIVRDLESKERPAEAKRIDEREIEAFCKGAAHVKLLKGRHAPETPSEAQASYITMQLEDEESLFPIALAFQAMESAFQSSSTTVLERGATELIAIADQEKSVSLMESTVDSMLRKLKADNAEFNDSEAKPRIMRVLQELQRSGPAELHNIASLVGGMVAQESIKILTKQYVPVDNLCVFDGITSKTAVYVT